MLVLTALRTQIKWILALFIVIFTLSVGFMYGTGRSGSGESERAGDFVVAKVNGEELRISQLQEHLRSFVERRGIRDLSDKQIPLIYKAVFDEMIANRAVIDEVTRLKISAPAEDVNSQLKAIEAQYVTKEAFMQAVRNQGQTMEQVRASIARELAINKMLEDVAGGVVVADDEVNALYDALKGNLTMPAGIEADYAQFKTKESAEMFVADLKADSDWAKAVEAAGENVVQSSAADKPERMANAEMAGKLEPVATLKDGETTAPIELSAENYFVVRRVKAVEQEVRPLSDVQESLKRMILQSKKAEAQQKYIKELTDKMEIEILTPDIFTPPAEEAAENAGGAAEVEAPATENAAPAAKEESTPSADKPASEAATDEPAVKSEGTVTNTAAPESASTEAAPETPAITAKIEEAATSAPQTENAEPAAETDNAQTAPEVKDVPAEEVKAGTPAAEKQESAADSAKSEAPAAENKEPVPETADTEQTPETKADADNAEAAPQPEETASEDKKSE